jgi:hypothetical protein
MKTGRPKIDWKNLPFEQYPLENLLGRRSRMKTWIKGRMEKIHKIDENIDKLKKDIQKLQDSKYPHQKKIHEWEREIKLMNISIGEKTKLTKGNESITLIKEDKVTRGKVSLYGKPRWVHIGSNHIKGLVHMNKLIGKMTDDELCDEFRFKLNQQMKKGKVQVLPERELKKRRGKVKQDLIGGIKKVTNKELKERDEYLGKVDSGKQSIYIDSSKKLPKRD